MRTAGVLLTALLLAGGNFLTDGAVRADSAPQPPPGGQGQTAVETGSPTVTTRHVLEIDGEQIAYIARAGEIVVESGQPKKKARIFSVAYDLDQSDRSRRPVTFAFNGGPGASSVWLHLGALGPKRVVLNDNGTAPAAPARLRDNPLTWLRFTDLVFIDPVGTGYSRALPSDREKDTVFYSVQEDIASVGEFIRMYLTINERWQSPKFLVGESYGGTRAAGLSRYLHDTYGIDLNGVLLLSPALDFNTLLFGSSNDLPYLLFLPTYAAAAWHYGLLMPSLQETGFEQLLGAAEDFCAGTYLESLFRGSGLTDSKKRDLVQSLAGYTGLKEEVVRLSDLRVGVNRFRTSLLRDSRRIIGRMDATIVGVVPRPLNPNQYDPSLYPLYGPFSEAINAYLREELNYKTDLPYEFLSTEVNLNWDWSSFLSQGQGYIDLSGALRDAMEVNAYLRVFIASGYFDLTTPYYTVKYTVDHMGLTPGMRDRISLSLYEAGHMIYTHQKARRKLAEAAAAFYAEALSRSGSTDVPGVRHCSSLTPLPPLPAGRPSGRPSGSRPR
jgi:carboxypeptidase C (cathepsin A)